MMLTLCDILSARHLLDLGMLTLLDADSDKKELDNPEVVAAVLPTRYGLS